MPVEISMNTPLADALNTAIQPKLVEVGWGTGGIDDTALAEYIILMLVNGKTQEQIAAELSGELLSLPSDDPVVLEFSRWLFEQIDLLNAELSGGQSAGGEAMADASQEGAFSTDMDTDMNPNDVSELNAPRGPRSMRNGNPRGGRDKRMLGHVHKAMDRTTDGTLHRTRGNDRISTHGRTPPTGPRTGPGRLPRHNNNSNNNRAASIQAGLAAGGPQGPGWMMQGQQPNQMELLAMLEQQNQMMYTLSQQLINGGGPNNGGFGQQRRGKSLFDRVSDPHHKNNFRKGGQSHQSNANAGGAEAEEAADGEDVDMSGGKREPPNPDESVCKYNLRCTNKDCRFAHQSPAAPPGVSVDVSDTCTFGAACKNRKCVGRHPSPAARLAHQSEQDCKFFPNCQNPQCPFKHPSMPICRNGTGCTTPNCRFTHVKTKCRFNPCLNPNCVFAHQEGQQGGFKDKVWTAEGEHVSERRFVDENASVEQVQPEGEHMAMDRAALDAEVIG
ncbi:Nuclear polyadenylated RNA-binding protein NAB2 [Tolypocladium capitatum]|uniref:Nuclear polyadenylated RNA-binding protein NAB2 n=1 Tax=Tolypocladium capitatum TaxID=45235 RepID=A0A2K3QHT5_9HYPO|nr:Nuclear polyadenylated RNA-binding protein NAB2 [Tolypocladium capitatum]